MSEHEGGIIISNEFGYNKFGKQMVRSTSWWPKMIERVEDLIERAKEIGFKNGKEESKMDAAIDKLPNLDIDNAPKEEPVVAQIISLIQLWNKEMPVPGENLFEILFNIKEHVNKRLRELSSKPKIIDPSTRSQEITDLNDAVKGFSERDFGLMSRSEIGDGVRNIAIAHAESELQKVYGLSDEDYKALQSKIQNIITPEHIPLKADPTNEEFIGESAKPGYTYKVGIDPAKEPADVWVDRTINMVCGTCMNYQPKGKDHRGKLIGACKNNSPTMKGYPRVFDDEAGCGEHKLRVYPKSNKRS